MVKPSKSQKMKHFCVTFVTISRNKVFWTSHTKANFNTKVKITFAAASSTRKETWPCTFKFLCCCCCCFCCCYWIKKCVHILLRIEFLRVEVKAGVNFINVMRTNFLYKRRFGSFFSSYVYVENAAEMMFVRKIRT